ncbi:MAG: hypothetical protein ACREV6_14655 [Clostridium sp.]|uniref:hypothetical protein n=1 Tax=Clostridium sp. TaxID=1506 RepID=UPI003D6D32DF
MINAEDLIVEVGFRFRVMPCQIGIHCELTIFSWIMLTKVYIAQNAFEQALVIQNLFYLQVRKEKCMSER